jgi:uridine kinase
MDHDLFLRHLTALRAGQSIERPVYDFANHCRTSKVEVVQPGPFVVVEGLLLFSWEDVRPLFHLKVFVDLDDQSCLERRILRDVKERGRTPESVILQFVETVRPMAEKYVRPARAMADLVVNGDDSIDQSVSAVLAELRRQRDCAAAM